MRRLAPSLALALALGLAALLCAGPASAQDDEARPGFLARQIENALSGPGRDVRVRGFQGALSGRATLERMTFADADGVWLTLEDAVLDWNRAALLRGRLSVNTLSAGRIAIDRRPLPAPDDGPPEPPSPEASGFSLPELPVTVNIRELEAGRLELGAPVLGEAADFTLDGSVRLEGGEGAVDIALDRLGGAEDTIALAASFDNDSRVLAVDLTVREEAGGLAGTLLGIPGAPPLTLDIEGTGPLDDYTAVVDLSTDGVQRVAGEITLRGTEEGGLRFAADVGGDVTPIVAPQFSDFFGPDIGLVAEGLRGPDGALTLERLSLTTRSLDLAGSAALDAGGQPVQFDLTGQLADPAGGPVRLPVEAPVEILRADLSARYDRDEGEDWTLSLVAEGLDTPALEAGEIRLTGGGAIQLDEAAPRVTATLDYAAQGLVPADPDLAQALGERIGGQADLAWQQGTPLSLSALTLGGADYGLEVTGDAQIAERTLQLDGAASLSAEDLSRFSGLAGRALAGQAEVSLTGQGDVLGGLFDVELDLRGEGLAVDQEVADRFLEGPVTLVAAARRDTTGTFLDRFDLDSTGLAAEARGQVGSGESDLSFSATLEDVGLLRPDLEGALTVSGDAAETEPGLWQVDLGLDGPYGAAGEVAGLVGTGGTQGQTAVELSLSVPDLAPIAPQIQGGVSVTGSAEAAGTGLWQVDLQADAPHDSDLTVAGTIGGGQGDVRLSAEVPDLSAFAPGVPGALSLRGTAQERTSGAWAVDLDAALPYDATAAVQGELGAGDAALSYSARLPDVGALAPQFTGALAATGTARQGAGGRWQVTADVDAPYGATADVQAELGGEARPVASAEIAVPDLSPVVPALRGPLDARLEATQQESGAWAVDVDGQGPFASTLTASGTVGGEATNATARLSLPDVSPLAPRLSGRLTLTAEARQAAGDPIRIDVGASGPLGTTARVSGQVGEGRGDLNLSARIPNLAPLVPGLEGSLRIDGTATEIRPGAAGPGWALDIQSRGPASAAASVTGVFQPGGQASSVRINGTAPLALANPFLAPQRLEGDVSFDLGLDGAPSLQALEGTLSTTDARLLVPAIDQGLEDIALTAELSGGTASVAGTAAGTSGGALSISGPIALSNPFVADLAVDLDALALEDPALFRTVLGGTITLQGPLRGTGATIGGRVDVGRTELRIPSGGVGFGGAIPPTLQHRAEPADVRLTRERAGLINVGREARGGERGGTIYALDLRVNAPQEVFLRGRGLDVELGGSFRIGGTTRAPAPVGAIEVIRGRLDILGRRLDLEQDGRVTLGGNLVPFLDLTAVSDDSGGADLTIFISIEGPVTEPAFSFQSSPQLPQDEVLARFFFGKGLANLSPVQTVQLAASVAQLTGRGGNGLLSGLRENLGVDDLNVVTDDEGEAALQVGRYLTDNIYTDVTTSTTGLTELNLNIDVTDTVTVKGSADNEGETSLGIFFERDY